MVVERDTGKKVIYRGNGINMAAWDRLPAHDENFTEAMGLSRRSMLKLMGASAALAMGVTGCKRKPKRAIVSRVSGPEYQKPGKALYYASTWTEGDFPYGMVVKTVDGRPIKIEGNPDHPINGGRTSALMQSSILGLYDPERLQTPMHNGETTSWTEADEQITTAIRQAESVVVMTRSTLGPSERRLMELFSKAVPQARHIVYESIHDESRRRVCERVYGQSGQWIPDLSAAKVVLSLECDFLGGDGVALEAIRDYANQREIGTDSAQGNNDNDIARLWSVESAVTLTGTNADHRIRLRPSAMRNFAEGLRAALAGDSSKLDQVVETHHLDAGLVTALVEDLKQHPGESVILAGGHLPEPIQASVVLLNEAVGAVGQTLKWNTRPATLRVTDRRQVISALREGVDVLLCLGVNPVYDWPGGEFKPWLDRAGLSVGHGLYLDETLSACDFALPSSHNLESWNDAVARAGVESLCQPMIRSLYESRQEAESLLKWTQALAPQEPQLQGMDDWHDFVRTQWGNRHYPDSVAPNAQWEAALRKGVAVTDVAVTRPSLNTNEAEALAAGELLEGGHFELVILPDAGVYDGRFANSSWQQELPDSVTRLVWDNAAMISPATAKRLGVKEGNADVGDLQVDQVTIETDVGSIVLPILILPGVADGVIVTTTGYGRSAGGSVGRNKGANAALLMGSGTAPRVWHSVQVTKATGRVPLVRTQKHFKMRGEKEKHNRPIALDGTLAEYRHDPHFVEHKRHVPEQVQLYEKHEANEIDYRWAMAIDLNRCVGCHACVTACQSENNIPVVGKEECGNGREMHWMRIDEYHTGEQDNPTVHHQPMLCQQCENAPCENVCPVNATTHSPEGLNEMVYNRCVGTRYCSNNCPYKVRRFNYYDYQKQTQPEVIQETRTPVEQLKHNPQVTVRSRGVMEKCTFCVQRINAAKYEAHNAGKRVADGQIQTACQQACPAQAIIFGNINDAQSRVARQQSSPLNYFVLEELNVKPSVGYLAKIRNRVATDDSEGAHA